MSNEHTPGPWTFKDEDGCKDINAEHNDICFTVGLPNDDEDRANAKLISEAPETLAELKIAKALNKELLEALEAVMRAEPLWMPPYEAFNESNKSEGQALNYMKLAVNQAIEKAK